MPHGLERPGDLAPLRQNLSQDLVRVEVVVLQTQLVRRPRQLAQAGGLALLGGDGGEFAILHALPEQKESRVGVVGVRHDAPLPREIERHRP